MGFNLGSLLIGECFRYCPKRIWIKSWLLNFVLFFLHFQVLGFAVKRALDFWAFCTLKPYKSTFTSLNLYQRLVNWSHLTPSNADRGVCTLIRRNTWLWIASGHSDPWCTVSLQELFKGGKMSSCDFIDIFIFSKLLLWTLNFVKLGCDSNVYFFSFFFVYFSCYVIQKLL